MARFWLQFYLPKENAGPFAFPSWCRGKRVGMDQWYYEGLIDSNDETTASFEATASITQRVQSGPIQLVVRQVASTYRPPPCRYPRPKWYKEY